MDGKYEERKEGNLPLRVNKRWRAVIGLTGVAALSVLAAACTSEVQPSVAQYAITTGHGNFSNQQVIAVTAPGDNVHLGSGTTTWYVWGDARNYVTAPANGDWSTPQAELTGPGGTTGSPLPGMSDYTWTYVGFELNPALVSKNSSGQFPVATSFLSFCLKYGCADTTAQNDNSTQNNGPRSVSAGWQDMINEVFPQALAQAEQQAIVTFGPNLWTDRAEWSTYGDDITKYLAAGIGKYSGEPAVPYFCGPDSTTTTCTPPSVTVQNVTPVDQSVVNAYNQEVTAQYQEQAGAARLKAAQEIYGSDANYFLGIIDTINASKAAGVPVTIYIGNPPVAPSK